ncbi:MAG: Rrf2 family transcriptional regulator [Roseiarcus sp.]
MHYRACQPTLHVAGMRLTTFTDFGLRALMRLAGDPERIFTTEEIATEFAISRNHLVKVIQQLAGAGFVVTQRGSGGGFRLAVPAEQIRIGEVVRSLESRQALVECFRADGGACVLTPKCLLKDLLAKAHDALLRELDETTLAECAYPGSSRKGASKRKAAA